VDSALTSTANIIDRDDWNDTNSPAFNRGGTLTRIRGSVSLLSGGVSSVGGAVWMAIWLVNDDETAPNPSTVNDYAENDCLWQKVVNFQTVFLTSVGGGGTPPAYFDIDVKAQRKLTSDSIVLFTWIATGGSSDEQAILSATLRGLVRKS